MTEGDSIPQQITVKLMPVALMQYQCLQYQNQEDFKNCQYVLYGRKQNNAYDIHDIVPWQVYNEKSQLNNEQIELIQKYQQETNQELFRVGVLFLSINQTKQENIVNSLESNFSINEFWVDDPIQLLVKVKEIATMTCQCVCKYQKQQLQLHIIQRPLDKMVIASMLQKEEAAFIV